MDTIFTKLQERKWFFSMMLKLMEKLLGQQKFDYWVWEMTCLPFGKPSLSMYVDGIKLAFKHKQ